MNMVQKHHPMHILAVIDTVVWSLNSLDLEVLGGFVCTGMGCCSQDFQYTKTVKEDPMDLRVFSPVCKHVLFTFSARLLLAQQTPEKSRIVLGVHQVKQF